MFNKLRNWFKNTFGFSKKEINGFIILTILMVLMLLAPLFFPQNSTYETAKEDKIILDSILNSVQKEQERKITFQNNNNSKKIEYKNFNPNSTTIEEWSSFGINQKIAQRIINYIENGGQFRTKEDLKKIYGFPDDHFERLYDYIELPEKSNFITSDTISNHYNPNNYPKKKEIIPFEINSCSVEELTQIKGIGEKLSERILKYRDKLGGFYTKDQYANIYGLDSLVLTELIKYSTIDASKITKININTATYEELKNHTFIDSKIANAIVNYRTQHGNYTSVSDLKNIYSIPKESLAKIEPYLKIE